MARACTINEPNMVSTIGYLARRVPARASATATLRRRVNEVLRARPPRRGRRHPGATRRACRSGITLAMSDYQAVDGGESKLDQIRRGMEDVFLDATAGDDFVGVQTYSRTRVGPERACSGPRTACPR